MTDIDLIPRLLQRIEKHLKKTGEKPSRFGRNAASNSTLIDRLKAGNVNLKTIRRVIDHLDKLDAA